MAAKRGHSSNGSLRTEYVALSELLKRHHPDNPRDHDLGGIVQSIRRFGFVRNVMLNEEDGLLLYGHGATLALAQMKDAGEHVPDRIQAIEGEWMVPTTRGAHMDALDAQAYLLADNQHVLAGGWHEPRLIDSLIALARSEALDGTGFDGDDVDRLIRFHRPEMLGISPEAARPWKKSASKTSDEQGALQITVQEAPARAVSQQSEDMVICPACGAEFKLNETIRNADPLN
jgi:hypothetical protein